MDYACLQAMNWSIVRMGTSGASPCPNLAWYDACDLEAEFGHTGQPMVNLCSGAHHAAT